MYKKIPPAWYKHAHNLWIMSFSPKTGAIYIKKNNRFQDLDQQICTGYFPYEIPVVFDAILIKFIYFITIILWIRPADLNIPNFSAN